MYTVYICIQYIQIHEHGMCLLLHGSCADVRMSHVVFALSCVRDLMCYVWDLVFVTYGL